MHTHTAHHCAARALKTPNTFQLSSRCLYQLKRGTRPTFTKSTKSLHPPGPRPRSPRPRFTSNRSIDPCAGASSTLLHHTAFTITQNSNKIYNEHPSNLAAPAGPNPHHNVQLSHTLPSILYHTYYTLPRCMAEPAAYPSSHSILHTLFYSALPPHTRTVDKRTLLRTITGSPTY